MLLPLGDDCHLFVMLGLPKDLPYAFVFACTNSGEVFTKRVSYLQEGDIVERGTHQQLVQMGGLYAEMWTRQAEAAVVEEICTADKFGTMDDKSNGDVSEMTAAHGSSNSLVH